MAVFRYSTRPYLTDDVTHALTRGQDVRVTNRRWMWGMVFAASVFWALIAGVVVNVDVTSHYFEPSDAYVLVVVGALAGAFAYVFGLAPGVRVTGTGIHVVGAVMAMHSPGLFTRYELHWGDISAFSAATWQERGLVAILESGERRQIPPLPFAEPGPFGLNHDPNPMLDAFNVRLQMERARLTPASVSQHLKDVPTLSRRVIRITVAAYVVTLAGLILGLGHARWLNDPQDPRHSGAAAIFVVVSCAFLAGMRVAHGVRYRWLNRHRGPIDAEDPKTNQSAPPK